MAMPLPHSIAGGNETAGRESTAIDGSAGRFLLRPWVFGAAVLLLQACAGDPPKYGTDHSVSSFPPPAGPRQAIQQSQLAYIMGDYQRAAQLLMPLAKSGDPTAEYALGYLYFYGYGVPQSLERAAAWIQAAAGQGYANARNALQVMGMQPQMAAASRKVVPPLATAGNPRRHEASPRVEPEASASPTKAEQYSFTIQLVSSHRPRWAHEYIARHRLQDHAGCFAVQSRNNTWYAVGYGRYATRGEAEEAMGRLPAALRADGAWVRGDAAIRDACEPAGSVTAHDDAVGEPRPAPSATPSAMGVVPAAGPEAPSRPSGHFTIQLAADRHEDDARAYIRRHRIEEWATYSSVLRAGQRWFAITYGAYATRPLARAALKTLSPDLRANGAWIRPLDGFDEGTTETASNPSRLAPSPPPRSRT